MIRLLGAGATHMGLNPGRTNNEDRFLTRDGLWLVADGVGGHAAGEVAAGLAVELIASDFQPQAPGSLAEAIQRANHAIWERAAAAPELHGMATTITALARLDVEGPDQLLVANVGDSRTYLLRDGELSRLTVDHSQVEEMVRDGIISRAEAARHPYRHIVTRVLGIDPEVEVDNWMITPVAGDRYLLCSDGLIDEVSDQEIEQILRQTAAPDAVAEQLIDTALAHGGSDNVTVVVVDAAGQSDGSAPAPGAAAAPAPAGLPTPAPPDSGLSAPADPTLSAPAESTLSTPAESTLSAPAESTLPAPVGAGAAVTRPTGGPTRGRRVVTPRAVVFILAVLVVIGGAVATVVWYARASYYVGLQGNQITIFKGRPGGVLWFKPTVAQRTSYTTAQVLPSALPNLESGMVESSYSAATQYVQNLIQADEAATAPVPPASIPTTSTPQTAVPGGTSGSSTTTVAP